MKITIFALFVASVACSATELKNDANWDQKTEKLRTMFENLVMRKTHQIISNIKNAEYSLRKDVRKFFLREQSKINSSVAAAIEDIKVLKDEDTPVYGMCVVTAVSELVAAQEAALANLLLCSKMSQSWQDIERIGEMSRPIIRDIIADVKVIIEGIADCGTQSVIVQPICVLEYIHREIDNLQHQWPEAEQFIYVTGQLGVDAIVQVKGCLYSPTQENLEARLVRALSAFINCFKP